jgi:hypothetical protein
MRSLMSQSSLDRRASPESVLASIVPVAECGAAKRRHAIGRASILDLSRGAICSGVPVLRINVTRTGLSP